MSDSFGITSNIFINSHYDINNIKFRYGHLRNTRLMIQISSIQTYKWLILLHTLITIFNQNRIRV